MNNLRSARLAVVPLLTLLATACAAPGGEVGETGVAGVDSAGSYPADAVVFRMAHVGGFVTPAMATAQLPAVSVYGDGRVITQGPTTLIFPGPALPNLQVHTISAQEVADLVERARSAGVGSGIDLGTPPVADAPITRFTVLGENGAEQLDVHALAEAAGASDGLTADQRAARDKLQAFAASLTGSSDGSLGEAADADFRPYQPTAVAAIAEAWRAADGGVDAQPEVAWPGPALPGAVFGDKNLGLGCVTVDGDAARKLLAVAAEANAATPWTSGGRRWTLTLRPLLPDETDCADLATDG